jgi:putative transposase
LFSGYATLTADLREMVNACCYLHKTGCPWRFLPTDFGPWQTVRTWHDRFRADGVWAEAAALLTRAVRQKRGRNPEPSTAILDSQSVVSGPQKGKRGFDGNKKIKGIKRHLLVDTGGLMLVVLVGPASVQDRDGVPDLLRKARRQFPWLAHLFADAAYAAAKVENALRRAGGMTLEIVRRPDAAKGFTKGFIPSPEKADSPWPLR